MSPAATAKTPQVAIYVRQSVREEQGIAQQVEECRGKASAEKWHVHDVYDDDRTSATKARGAGTEWARMLADIDAGRVDTVLVVAVDRLMRRLVDVLEVRPPRRDVRVVVVRGGIDTADPMGAFILSLFVLVAENEIDRKEQRAVPYRAGRREAGHPTPGLVPYGYRWVPKLHRDGRGTRYAIVPEEAAAVRYMSSELLGGADLGAIATALNDGTAKDERGCTLHESTRLTRPRRDPDGTVKRPGVKWTSTTLGRILRSPYQAALLPPAMPEGKHYSATAYTLSECTPGAWDWILEEDAVATARGRLLDPARLKHDGDTRAKWLLTGLGKCGKCGAATRKCTLDSAAGPVRGYRCMKGCFQRPAALIEEYVECAAVDVLSAPGLLTFVDDGGHDVQALRTRREAIDADEAEWFARVRAGTLKPAQWDVLSAGWAAERVQLDADIAEAVSVDPLATFVGASDLRKLWDGLSLARRRAVLGALLFSIVVHPVGNGNRVRTLEAMEGTVDMNWKRAERRVKFDAARAVSSVRPGVPVNARGDIGAALNV